VGALDRIISPDKLRLYLIDAVERGISKENKQATEVEVLEAA
jgi:endonuclease YncB( thermonuclease family)